MSSQRKNKWEKLTVGVKEGEKGESWRPREEDWQREKRETSLRIGDSFVVFVHGCVGVLGVIGAKLLGFAYFHLQQKCQ